MKPLSRSSWARAACVVLAYPPARYVWDYSGPDARAVFSGLAVFVLVAVAIFITTFPPERDTP